MFQRQLPHHLLQLDDTPAGGKVSRAAVESFWVFYAAGGPVNTRFGADRWRERGKYIDERVLDARFFFVLVSRR